MHCKSLITATFFVFCSIESTGQDDERNDLPAIQWLAGTWEGTGFASPLYQGNGSNKPIESSKFDLFVHYTKDSMKIVLTGSSQKHSPRTYIDQTIVDFVANERVGLYQIIRVLFLNANREGGRYEDKALFIFPIDTDHINVSLTYYARQEKEGLVMHGAFKRKK